MQEQGFYNNGSFPLRAWNGVFFVSFIDFFCFAKILSEERSIKQTKNAPFHARTGNEPYGLRKELVMIYFQLLTENRISKPIELTKISCSQFSESFDSCSSLTVIYRKKEQKYFRN